MRSHRREEFEGHTGFLKDSKVRHERAYELKRRARHTGYRILVNLVDKKMYVDLNPKKGAILMRKPICSSNVPAYPFSLSNLETSGGLKSEMGEDSESATPIGPVRMFQTSLALSEM